MMLVAWHSLNTFHSINDVTLHRAPLVLGWVTKPSQLGRLSLLLAVGW